MRAKFNNFTRLIFIYNGIRKGLINIKICIKIYILINFVLQIITFWLLIITISY